MSKNANSGLAIDNYNVFFWSGWLSQWYPSKFTIDNITYSCAEQYMMSQKALLFNDQENYALIMNTADPKKQKAYGRKVKNFNQYVWIEKREEFVYQANLAKFTDNPNLLKLLLDTENRQLVEASPKDNIWGIGMGTNDPNIGNKSSWGLNLLGKALVKVRDVLRK